MPISFLQAAQNRLKYNKTTIDGSEIRHINNQLSLVGSCFPIIYKGLATSFRWFTRHFLEVPYDPKIRCAIIRNFNVPALKNTITLARNQDETWGNWERGT